MMKKIFALVLFLVLGKLSYSQNYPLTQNLGSDSTIVVSKGALQSRLIPIVITDTNAANAQRMKNYPGAQLYTTNGNFYIRNSNATKWVLVSSGSFGSVNIYNSDGTLTGNRVLTGAGNSLSFNQLSELLATSDTTIFNTDQLTVRSDKAGVGSLAVKGRGGRTLLIDTAAAADEQIFELKSSNGDFFISRLSDNQVLRDSVFTITNTNNVGINTSTPTARLAIVDTGGYALKINYNSASTDANNNAAIYAENNGLSSYVTIFNEKTTNNTGGQYPLLVESSLLSGTAQAGMATGIHFGVPDDAGNRKVTQLALRTTNPAAATYTNRAELRLWNNGTLSTPYYLLGNGNMGLGTSAPDSNLTVVNGAYFQRGIRASGLPQAPGTKALRVDASGTISYSDTLVDAGGTVTSVGLTMPSAFIVSNTPITSSGDIAVIGAGVASQYIRGDGQLATLPTTGGGGSSVSYYLNGSINQGTFGGNTYYQMNKTPVIGTGTDFNISSNGYIASFITDAGDPDLINIPAGNWDFELYFQSSSSSGTPSFYVELYKYNGTTFTLIASSSTNPKFITGGTAVDAYYTPLAVPSTTLAVTDRLAIRVYVNNSGNTITLHTEDNNLCQVITTFSTGINAINGLTDQVQYFATGTSGTDFNISSLTDTHTFNLPVASGTNTGKLSSSDWTTFNSKVGGTLINGYVTKATGANTIDTSQIYQSNGLVGIGTTSPANKLDVYGIIGVNTSGQTRTISTYQGPGSDGYNIFIGGGGLNSQNGGIGFTGSYNTSMGVEALLSNTTGQSNMAFGNGSLRNNTTGGFNASFGGLYFNTTGRFNTSIGGASLFFNTTGDFNTALGYDAGSRTNASTANQTSNNSVYLGYDTRSSASGNTNEIVIGASAQGNGSNSVTLGNSSITKTILSPNVGVNTTTIGSTLQVNGNTAIGYGSSTAAPTNGLAVSGNVGIGTLTADSALTVLNGTYLQRGVRMSGLPSAPGTKALRIDANGTLSVADTTTGGGGGSGTVTSVATNNGTGITGGTITTAGTLAIDTTLISTRAWRQKGVDSVAALANTKISGSGTTNYVPKFTGTSSIGNSQIFDNGTNVGIGTTSPNVLLHVEGTTGTAKIASTSTTAGNYPYLTFLHAGNDEFRIGGGDGLRFISSGTTERMRITSGGNVGINTITIGSRLQINGNAAIGYSASTAAPTNGLVVAGNVGIGTIAPTAYTGYNTLAINGTTAGVLDIMNNGTVRGQISGGTGNFYVEAKGATIPLEFYTNALLRMQINSAGVIFAGNGETAASPSTGIISGTGGTGTNIAGAEFRIRGGASTGSGAGGPITFYTSAAGTAGTGVNAATEKMRLDALGNLGLGVTPSAWRSTQKAIQIGTYTAISDVTRYTYLSNNFWVNSSNQNIYLNNDGASTYELFNGGHTWYNAASGTAGNAFTFTTQMNLNSSGNLGIATTTIGSRLQVNGNAAIGYSASTAAPTNGLSVAGNVAIGTATTSSWTSNIKVIEFANLTNTSTTFGAGYESGYMVNNGFFDGTSWKYKGAKASAMYEQAGGTHNFNVSTIGTAGASITYLTALAISTSGATTFTPNTNTSAIITSGYSLTGANAQSLLDLAGTWNTTGNPTAIKLNITNTASGATANLMDLQVGGVSQFTVNKGGNATINNASATLDLSVSGTRTASFFLSSGIPVLSSITNTSLILGANGNANMYLFPSANVGIGTPNVDPGFKLDVVGTFRTSGQNTLSNLAGTGTRMVVANSTGVLSTQTIPSGGASEEFNTIAFQALGSAFLGYQPHNIPRLIQGPQGLTSGRLQFSAYYLPVAQTITGVKWFQGTQGNYTANNYNGVALYSYSGGTLTLVASSTNDGNIWKATASTWTSKAFSAPYSAAAGIYFLAYIYSNSAVVTNPTIGAGSNPTAGSITYDFTNSARIMMQIDAQTSLPATQLASGLTSASANHVLALY